MQGRHTGHLWLLPAHCMATRIRVDEDTLWVFAAGLCVLQVRGESRGAGRACRGAVPLSPGSPACSKREREEDLPQRCLSSPGVVAGKRPECAELLCRSFSLAGRVLWLRRKTCQSGYGVVRGLGSGDTAFSRSEWGLAETV